MADQRPPVPPPLPVTPPPIADTTAWPAAETIADQFPLASSARRQRKKTTGAFSIVAILFSASVIAGGVVWLAIGHQKGTTLTGRHTGPQLAVIDYLNARENSWQVVRWYGAESTNGARARHPMAGVTDRIDAVYAGEWDRGTAIELEYETDEGFGRTASHDRVFLIDNDGHVRADTDPRHFFVAKPNTINAPSKRDQMMEEFRGLGRRSK